MTLSIDSFAVKIVKKTEELAFSHKAKIINLSIPEKIKIFIEKHLVKQINYLRTKYKFEFNLISDKNLLLPEYKIDLLNKNKKTIKKIENIEDIDKAFEKQGEKRKNFINKKYNKKFNKRNNFQNKYNYQSKFKKNNINNKKLVNY